MQIQRGDDPGASVTLRSTGGVDVLTGEAKGPKGVIDEAPSCAVGSLRRSELGVGLMQDMSDVAYGVAE